MAYYKRPVPNVNPTCTRLLVSATRANLMGPCSLLDNRRGSGDRVNIHYISFLHLDPRAQEGRQRPWGLVPPKITGAESKG